VVEVTYQNDKKQVLEDTYLTVVFVGTGNTPSKLGATAYFPAATLLPDLPGVRPQVASQTSVRASTDFTSYPNSLMNGCSYKSIPNLTEETCKTRCSADLACAAYNYNKINHACDLKHTLTARQLNPLWMTGVPSAGPLSEKSSRAIKMGFGPINQSQRVEGSVIDATKIEDERGNSGLICASKCESDPVCLAADINASTDLCTRFSSVDSVKPRSKDQSSDTYIKTQH